MKKTLLALSFLALSGAAMAQVDDEKGFFIGAGAAATANDDCGSWCDTTGYAVEAGYFFNKIVGVEAKIGNTEFEEDSYIEDDLTYFGANIGHTFNSSWVRLYGKVGYLDVEQTDSYSDETMSDSALALGIGVSFTPAGHQNGLYIKLESMTSEVFDDTTGYGQLSVGYQF